MTDLDTIQAETHAALAAAADPRALDAVRVSLLGKSGRLTTLLKELGRAAPEDRRERGAALNRLRDSLTAAIDARRAVLDAAALDARLAAERLDVTLPPPPEPPGLTHAISRTMDEMAAIFGAMGFRVGEGLDIQTDWYNFSALNIPGHHPARADHDTFYLPGLRDGRPLLLRTQTSDVADHRHAHPAAALAPDRAGPGLPRRPRRHPFADVPSMRGHRHRPRPHARPSEGLLDRLPARLLRHRRPARPLPQQLFPVHRTLHGGRYRLEPPHRRTRRRRRLA